MSNVTYPQDASYISADPSCISRDMLSLSLSLFIFPTVAVRKLPSDTISSSVLISRSSSRGCSSRKGTNNETGVRVY